MKKSLWLIAGILFLAIAAARADNGDKSKSLLWRITGKGLAKPSYLFGTIHLICPDDYLWTDAMKNSLSASEKVCFEMDLDDHETMLAASEGLMDTSGKTLKDYFTPEQYRRLKKFVKDTIGMDIFMFQSMKPMALQSVIEMKATQCTMPVSYEETIMKTALADKKEILGLEAPQEQITALESMPADSVARDMMDDIDNFNKSRQEYAELVRAYKNQELPELYRMITASENMGASMGPVLDDRNKRWIPRMAVKMSASSVFFAVGAGHLAGDVGVINLLRKAGYTVEPIK